MEQNGWDKNELIGHFHWGNTNTGEYENYGSKTFIENSTDEFHVYSLEWTKDHLKILVDNKEFLIMDNTALVPYDNPHYILLNIAMGGNLELLKRVFLVILWRSITYGYLKNKQL